ncbi:MAG: nucleoside triphosphate pyrophosphohydrolase [Clostridia bacterium]|nr:nucleoside triphosphate pyrophosphohydrolase [Clostridia bacterium]
MKEYHKLVRDKIPQIIRQGGETPFVRVLEDEEYIQHLEQKLDEEVQEYHTDKNVEELADILEVVYALAAAGGYSKEELLAVYQHKHDARGGFASRIFLIGKE